MNFEQTKKPRFGSGLFWRTFVMLAILIAVSTAIWISTFRFVENPPMANQGAAQIVSAIAITRVALTSADPEHRQKLLVDLLQNEGIRIYPYSEKDVFEPPDDLTALDKQTLDIAKKQLGENTKFAVKLNGMDGFWLSFKIKKDEEYWLMLRKRKINRATPTQWATWLSITLILSLITAAFFSFLLNRPLIRLADAARLLAKGQQPPKLPETGPREIAEVNYSFNQMTEEFQEYENNRAMILAGISHDLRTPLTRIQLEIEMANISESERQAMHADIDQMNAIIGQFLDYARPMESDEISEPLNIAEVLDETIQVFQRYPNTSIQSDISEKNMFVRGDKMEIQRAINNIFENAQRYGRTKKTKSCDLIVSAQKKGNQIIINISDNGIGIPKESLHKIMRPFVRLDEARSQASGAGLGLAIVDRIVKKHNGTFRLENRKQGGLNAVMEFPYAGKQKNGKRST